MNKKILIVIILLIVIAAGVGIYIYTQPAQPTATERIVIGVTDKVTDLDPSNAYDFFTWEILSNVMEGLVKYKPGT
ncbi:MAG: peptide ABC transporter substrate-binding protein, partial [Thermosphaera sp.]